MSIHGSALWVRVTEPASGSPAAVDGLLYLHLRVSEEVDIAIRGRREGIDEDLDGFVCGSPAMFGAEPDVSRRA